MTTSKALESIQDKVWIPTKCKESHVCQAVAPSYSSFGKIATKIQRQSEDPYNARDDS